MEQEIQLISRHHTTLLCIQFLWNISALALPEVQTPGGVGGNTGIQSARAPPGRACRRTPNGIGVVHGFLRQCPRLIVYIQQFDVYETRQGALPEWALNARR